MGAFVVELLPYLLSVAKAGGDIIEAINWGNTKVAGWQASGADPSDADFEELRSRRHANDEIINRG